MLLRIRRSSKITPFISFPQYRYTTKGYRPSLYLRVQTLLLSRHPILFLYFEYLLLNLSVCAAVIIITAPDPAFMDSLYIDQSTQDSRHNRSRSNSYLSSTAAQFQGLNLDNTSSASDQIVTSAESQLIAAYRTASPTFPDSHPSPKTYLSTPVPEQTTPFPLLSQSDLDVDWDFLTGTANHSAPAPLLRLDPAQAFPEDQSLGVHRPLYRSHSNPDNMR